MRREKDDAPITDGMVTLAGPTRIPRSLISWLRWPKSDFLKLMIILGILMGFFGAVALAQYFTQCYPKTPITRCFGRWGEK